MNYIDELNKSQRNAVLYNDGHSMVIAGAGSGKTRVLTYKIAYLLEQGIDPSQILALTFTNKAAGEMKARISNVVGFSCANRLWMGTFHSVFSRILRCESALLGYSRNFTIYDSSDSQSLIRSIIKELALDDKIYKTAVIQNRISTAKNRLYTSAMYSQNAEILKADSFKKIPMTKVIYEKYTERCKKADAMDFDDLLLNTYLLLKNYPEVQKKYSDLFRYILVDEYQDTNHAQHSIVWLLTRGCARLCVVGDDAQSIYSFRGANIQNMLSFEKLYPDYKLFKLEQNYRSTQTIVNAAGSLIAKNHSQIRKNVFSENEKGGKIELTRAHSDLEEATMVVNKLLDLHTYHNVDWNETAILYRTNGQSRVLEETFRKNGLPYRIYGSLSFYQRKEIKDTLAYMRVIVNPNDEESIKRIINFPKRGIGDTTINKLKTAAIDNNVTLWDVICNPNDFGVSINSGTQKKLYDFSMLLRSLMNGVSTNDAYTIAKRVYEESGLNTELNTDKTPEGLARKENVDELISGIQMFCKDRIEEGSDEIFLSHYLSSVSLMTDQDKEEDPEVSKVTMMTIHASKGLEFKAVMIVGLEENIFPNEMSSASEHELEEERRLMYVAMTRAEKYLYLFFATTRFRNGNFEANQPSRFIRDIDPAYINKVSEDPFSKPRFTSSSVSNFSSFEQRTHRPGIGTTSNNGYNQSRQFTERTKPKIQFDERKPKSKFQVVTEEMLQRTAAVKSDTNIQVGSIIEHDRFGIGRVLEMEGIGGDTKATIQFTNFGRKVLLLKFAKLTLLK